MTLQTDLTAISHFAEEKKEENEKFIEHLSALNNEAVDAMVFELNNEITPQINCIDCGNCCKSLMINVKAEEAENIALHLKISREKFDELYIEKGESGRMLVNQIPCHFLSNNACTIYEHRFEGCKEFPALHLPNFKKRLFTVFMHYDRCPIIFNVVEALKEKVTNF